MAGRLGVAQQLSLAGIFIGAVLCLIGLGAPYWFGAEVVRSGQSASVNAGVYLVCAHALGQSDCEWIDTDENFMYVVRGCSTACVVVGGICALVALSLACCGRGRLIVLGVICFVAAVVGAVAPGVFANKFDEIKSTIPAAAANVLSFEWAFYMFCAGVAVLGIASIMACISPPVNPNEGMFLGYSPSGPSVFMTQSHMQTGNHPYATLQNTSTMATGTSGPGVKMFSTSSNAIY